MTQRNILKSFPHQCSAPQVSSPMLQWRNKSVPILITSLLRNSLQMARILWLRFPHQTWSYSFQTSWLRLFLPSFLCTKSQICRIQYPPAVALMMIPLLPIRNLSPNPQPLHHTLSLMVNPQSHSWVATTIQHHRTSPNRMQIPSLLGQLPSTSQIAIHTVHLTCLPPRLFHWMGN